MEQLISGFTFIKDALTLGYPIKECLESLEPLCDQLVITVGYDDPELQKDDGTYAYLRDHFTHKKFLFQKSFWDPSMKQEGFILSQQANYSLRECRGKFCHFLHGDEILHEDDLPIIHNAVIEMDRNPKIQALVFDQLHFYSGPEILRHTQELPRRSIRLIRNKMAAKATHNIQNFVGRNEERLHCQKIAARIFHYGHCFEAGLYQKKQENLNRYFKVPKNIHSYHHSLGLKPFAGKHPAIIKSWLEKNKNSTNPLNLPPQHQLKNLLYLSGDIIENLTGMRLQEYKDYKLI